MFTCRCSNGNGNGNGGGGCVVVERSDGESVLAKMRLRRLKKRERAFENRLSVVILVPLTLGFYIRSL